MSTPHDLAVLFENHARVVYRYARLQLDPADAEDATSEVFVVAARRLDDVPEHARPWLLGVTRGVVANQVRSLRRRRALVDRVASATQHATAPPGVGTEELDRLRRAVGRLREPDRQVIGLVAAAGLTTAELGEVLGCSANTAAVRLRRARERLRAVLAREEPPGAPAVAVSGVARQGRP